MRFASSESPDRLERAFQRGRRRPRPTAIIQTGDNSVTNAPSPLVSIATIFGPDC
jgi:hypothetical protein